MRSGSGETGACCGHQAGDGNGCICSRSRRTTQCSAETSAPKSKAFVDALLASPTPGSVEYSLTSRELRAIVVDEPVAAVTRPMIEPFPDVVQDLWQLSYISPSYVARAAGGAVLLANGLIDNSSISIVIAALFLPFLSQLLAISFGLWSADFKLVRHGVLALLTSAVLAFAAGVVVAWASGGPVKFQDFKSPLTSFCISAVIGIAAGLSIADDAGRRYPIGVAAAVQLAIFPVWYGAALMVGLPEGGVVTQRMWTFPINLATISAAALIAFATLHLRPGKPRSSPLRAVR